MILRCVKPFVKGEHAYGCGQCMPCRFNKQRVWYHRILLEGLCHERSSFLTLTYSPEALPANNSVSPEDLRNWLKRIRKAHEPVKLRFFAAAEYGEVTQRPHYHVVLYGVSCAQGPYTRDVTLGREDWRCACDFCSKLRASWPNGFTSTAPLNAERAKYISGYVVKKMTGRDDPRLAGRHPEFARMSTHPGLGHDFLWDISSQMLKFHLPLIKALSYNGKSLPLGRYLRRKLATFANVEVPEYKDTALLQVRSFAWSRGQSVSQTFSELWSDYEASLQNKLRLAHEKKQTQAFSL